MWENNELQLNPFSLCHSPCVCISRFSHIWPIAALWTVAHQAPLSKEFFRQEYWSGLPCYSAGHLPHPGREPRSLALQEDALPSEPPGKGPPPLCPYTKYSAPIADDLLYCHSRKKWKCRGNASGRSLKSIVASWPWRSNCSLEDWRRRSEPHCRSCGKAGTGWCSRAGPWRSWQRSWGRGASGQPWACWRWGRLPGRRRMGTPETRGQTAAFGDNSLGSVAL